MVLYFYVLVLAGGFIPESVNKKCTCSFARLFTIRQNLITESIALRTGLPPLTNAVWIIYAGCHHQQNSVYFKAFYLLVSSDPRLTCVLSCSNKVLATF